MKRIRWELEEMVAMVDLYYRDKNGEVDNLNDELSELSRKLNKRADILDIDHDYKFRNLNGMKMIFQNVLYADTDGEKGMANTSRLIYDTIDLYNKRHDYFIAIPESVKLKNQISSKVSLQAKNKAKSSHSKCTQKVHENWKTPAFYAIIEVDKSGIGCGKNEL